MVGVSRSQDRCHQEVTVASWEFYAGIFYLSLLFFIILVWSHTQQCLGDQRCLALNMGLLHVKPATQWLNKLSGPCRCVLNARFWIWEIVQGKALIVLVQVSPLPPTKETPAFEFKDLRWLEWGVIFTLYSSDPKWIWSEPMLWSGDCLLGNLRWVCTLCRVLRSFRKECSEI